MYTEIKVQFSDVTGEGATETFVGSGLVAADSQAGLVTALDAISDAGITGMTFTAAATNATGTATDGDYATADDKAEFIFSSSAGDYRISIPAPNEAIFLPDKERVNPAETTASAFISAIQTNAKDPNGNALVFKSGRRVRVLTKKS